MKHNQKLTTVTRRDLSPGYQAVQSAHSIADFAIQHPQEFKDWHENSNYLCQLSVENEEELAKLAFKAEAKGIKITRFYEPDLNDQLTSICLEASDSTRRVTSNLPLMLKELNQEVEMKVA